MTVEYYIEKDFGNKTFLRLAGGKQHLLDRLTRMLPSGIETLRYIEPFIGGGSLFFATSPANARISDANRLIIEMYRFLLDDPLAVHSHLLKLAERHNEDFYYEVRSSFNAKRASYKRAAQLIYMNRSCFNGVFRVNQKSKFNVPWGKKQQILIPTLEYLIRVADLLRKTEIILGDFAGSLKDVGQGDMVYLDPPYVPIDRTEVVWEN
jgi:DNA adenine methylase